MPGRYSYFAPCPKGVEPLLANELRRIGLSGVRPQRSGALFSGDVADGLKALLWTRLASRVLLKLGEADASTADSLYEGVIALPWEDHLRASGTLAVDATGTNEALRNTQFTAVRVKDAIADRFRERFGRRPSVDVRDPDVRVNVVVREAKATISIDLASAPLHRRGYRESGVQVAAPMKETLAAAVLSWAGWDEIAASGGALVDPMCGSGTIAIEAALIAGDVAPGLLRDIVASERWLGFDATSWAESRAAAETRRREGLSRVPAIAASDSDPRAVQIARRCLQRAGLEGLVSVERQELARLLPPQGAPSGLVATNPPWGERLSDRRELPALYGVLAERLRAGFAGWKCAVASPDSQLRACLGMTEVGRQTMGSGKGVAEVTLFDVTATAGESATLPAKPAAPSRATATVEAVRGADEFANRLTKMTRHFSKWARRANVSCYRVYDADLPDFAVAVDVYEGAGPDDGKRWVHVSEYTAPAEVDEAKASARLAAAVGMAAEVLEVPADAVFLKRRERQRGSNQYQRLSDSSVTGVVAEGGLLFEVNFTDYLDTGLFLDHRITRGIVREMAEGRRFLNMFAYTGSATVYAAAGGASSTTTTDLSEKYLEWAERNMRLNAFTGEQHERVARDALQFVERARKRSDVYDLVFCDPPTFSNSKRTAGTFDVQRDHVTLLSAVETILAEKGVVVFSCNRRSFALDEAGLAAAGLTVRDITARTIPPDFERRPGVHRCFLVERA